MNFGHLAFIITKSATKHERWYKEYSKYPNDTSHHTNDSMEDTGSLKESQVGTKILDVVHRLVQVSEHANLAAIHLKVKSWEPKKIK